MFSIITIFCYHFSFYLINNKTIYLLLFIIIASANLTGVGALKYPMASVTVQIIFLA